MKKNMLAFGVILLVIGGIIMFSFGFPNEETNHIIYTKQMGGLNLILTCAVAVLASTYKK